MENFKLSKKDAIYVTSWASYNEGLGSGGWLMLDNLVDLDQADLFKEYAKIDLEPAGFDEELVVHDYDDMSGVGYYELLGENHPQAAINLYNELAALEDNEFQAFIGIKEAWGADDAMSKLESNELQNFNVLNESDFDDYLDMIAESYFENGDTRFIQSYLDYEMLIRDLNLDYDEDDEESFEATYDNVDEYIDVASSEFLQRYFDYDEFKRNVLMEGYIEEFEYDGFAYYLMEA